MVDENDNFDEYEMKDVGKKNNGDENEIVHNLLKMGMVIKKIIMMKMIYMMEMKTNGMI